MNSYDVIIVGGGLAGLSGAFYLTKEKKKVLLVEAKDFVGGRTASWNEKGMLVESGLHKFLGFYTELPKLCKEAEIDFDKMLIWENEIEIRLPDGGPQAIFGASIGKPVQTLLSSIGNNDMFSLSEKAEIIKLFSQATIDYAKDKESLDRITVTGYAKKHGISENVIQRLLIPLTEGIFFLPPEKYSMFVLASFIGVPKFNLIKTGVGAFSGGMTEVMCQPIAEAIVRQGGEVRTGAPVEKLVIENEKVTGVVIDGKKLSADYVVLATSLGPAQKLLKSHFATHSWFTDLLNLPTMPAVTIQFEMKEPAMDVDHATFGPTTLLACFSEQSRTTFRHVNGRLSVILGQAEKYIKKTDKEILSDVLKDAERLHLNISEKTITDYRVITEPMDFYELSINKEKHKPTQKTPIPGLLLAGDYTKQPYLCTMEGATLSGKRAAEIITNI